VGFTVINLEDVKRIIGKKELALAGAVSSMQLGNFRSRINQV